MRSKIALSVQFVAMDGVFGEDIAVGGHMGR